ncbi:MAG: Ankyrin-2 [Cirrosporium novae-zelandiae]|nr:MAG: Ankyrin-2 [Cirrosporium novae-zelandiae]
MLNVTGLEWDNHWELVSSDPLFQESNFGEITSSRSLSNPSISLCSGNTQSAFFPQKSDFFANFDVSNDSSVFCTADSSPMSSSSSIASSAESSDEDEVDSSVAESENDYGQESALEADEELAMSDNKDSAASDNIVSKACVVAVNAADMIREKYELGDIVKSPSPALMIQELATKLLQRIIDNPSTSIDGNICPIILIGDFVGGIILQQALLFATHDSEYREIASKIWLLVFFGTPHRARGLDDWDKIVLNLILANVPGPYDGWLPDSVKRCSLYLSQVCDEFEYVAQNHRIIDFYQKPGLDDAYPVVINKYSVTLDASLEERISLQTSYDGMPKFTSSKQVDILLDAFHGVSTMSQEGPDKVLVDCVVTLCHRNPESSVSRHIPKDQEGLFCWILDHPTYNSWIEAVLPNILLLSSSRPYDSAALSQFLVSSVRENKCSSHDVVVSSTLDKKGGIRHTVSHLLASLSGQLLHLRPSLFNHVRDLYQQMKKTGTWTEFELWTLLRSLLCSPSGIYITCIISCIQASDMSHHRLLQSLAVLRDTSEASFKILITFQEHVDAVKKAVVPCLCIDLDSPESEICAQNVIMSHAGRLIKSKPALDELQQEPFQGLLHRAAKDYVSTMCLMKYLEVVSVRSNPSATRAELISLLMANTENVSAAVLKKLLESKVDWTCKVLKCVYFALRLLTLDELAIMSAAIDNEKFVDLATDDIPRDIEEDIRQALPGVLQIKDRKVSFVDDRLKNLIASHAFSGFDWNPGKNYSIFLRFCLASLSNEKSQLVKGVNQHEIPKGDRQICGLITSSLHQYAVRNWPAHYMLAHDSLEDDLSVLEFLRNADLLKAWSDEYWLENIPIRKIRCGVTTVSPLQISCLLGVTRLLELLLCSSFEFTIKDHDQSLELAARNGHIEAVTILLKCKIVTSAGIGAALLQATEFCNEDVAMELIEASTRDFILESAPSLIHFATVNGSAKLVERIILQWREEPGYTQDSYTELLTAAAYGHLSIVSIFTKMGPPATSVKDNEDNTPLHLASERGHLAVTKHLISYHASVNNPNKFNETPLHMASKNGFLGVVDFLIESGGFPSAVDLKGRSPLHLACMNGWYEISRTLIQKNIDINTQDEERYTPLHYAAKNGHTRLVQLLINNHAQFWLRNAREETALLTALRNKCEDAAQLLVAPFPEQEAQEGQHTKNSGVHRSIERPNTQEYLGTVDNTNQTAFTIAVENGMPAIASEILSSEGYLMLSGSHDEGILITASRKKYTDIVHALLKSGMDPNTFPGNRSPLTIAAKNDDYRIIEILLKSGAKDDFEDKTGLMVASKHGHLGIVELLVQFASRELPESFTAYLNRALMKAAIWDREKVAEFLLKVGADVNYGDVDGNTPLQLAAFNSNTNIVRLLLLHRADMELRDSSDSSALSDAAYRNSIEALEMLLTAGANKDTTNNKGSTPIMRAVSKGHFEIVQILINSGANLDIYNKKGETALTKAVSKDYMDIMALLLDAGADIEVQNGENQTPLMLAVSRGHKEAVKFLIHRNANLNATDNSEATPVIIAIRYNHIEILTLLLGAGASIHFDPLWYGTLLHKAAYDGDMDLVKIILSNKVDVNWEAGNYGTALQAAAYSDKEEMVELLLKDHLADVNKTGGSYFTALQAAALRSSNGQVVKLLLEDEAELDLVGGMFGTALHAAAARSSSLIVEMILEKGPQRDQKDLQGRLAIHMAAWSGGWDIIKMIAGEEDPVLLLESRDKQGRTGMHFAAAGGKHEVIKRLHETRTDLDVEDGDGWTPLHWACRQNSEEVVKCLLKYGADPRHMTRRGWTPVHVAIFHGKPTIQGLLESHIAGLSYQNKANFLQRKSDDDKFSDSLPSEKASIHDGFSCDGCYCVSPVS